MSDVNLNKSVVTVNGKSVIDITDQTVTTTEYAISANVCNSRKFFAAPAYGNFSLKLYEATRYKTFTEALDQVDILKKYDCTDIQIHEIIIDVHVGRTVSA